MVLSAAPYMQPLRDLHSCQVSGPISRLCVGFLTRSHGRLARLPAHHRNPPMVSGQFGHVYNTYNTATLLSRLSECVEPLSYLYIGLHLDFARSGAPHQGSVDFPA